MSKSDLHTVLQKFIFALFFGATLSCFAAEQREIVLKDGSVITGEVLKFDGTQYTINSPSLGTVNINNAEISMIRSPSSTSKSNPDLMTISPTDIGAMQQQLMVNPEIMALINSLQNDPQVRAILSDPELMQAINAGNIEALLNNPKLKELADNPTIKSITEQNTQ